MEKHHRILSIIALALIALACDERKESNTVTLNAPVGYELESGALTAYDFNDGQRGKKLAGVAFDRTTPTLDLGDFRGHVYLALTQVKYRDEGLGKTVAFNDEDAWVALQDGYEGGDIAVNINLITTLAANYAIYLIELEKVQPREAILRANLQVGKHFGGIEVLRTVPDALSAQIGSLNASVLYGVSLYGLCQLAITHGGASLVDLSRVLVRDIQDGQLNGKNWGEALNLGDQAISPDTLSAGLADAITSFAQTERMKDIDLNSARLSDFLNSVRNPTSEIFSNDPLFGNDFTAPVITVQTLNNGQFLSGNVQVVARATDDISGVKSLVARLGNSFLQDNDSDPAVFSSNMSTITQNDGSHVVSFISRDIAGNETVQNLLVIFDNQVPQLEVSVNGDMMHPSDYTGGVFNLVVRVPNESEVRSLSVSTDHSGVNGTLSDTNPASNVFETLMDAVSFLGQEDALTVIADTVDLSGNHTTLSIPLNIDNRGPRYSFIHPRSAQYIEGILNAEINLDNRFGIASARVFLTQGNLSQELFDSTPGDGFEHFTSNIDTNQWPDGNSILEISAIDLVGIETNDLIIFNINNQLFNETMSFNSIENLPIAGYGGFVVTGDLNNDGVGDVVSLGRGYIPGTLRTHLYTFFGGGMTSKTSGFITNQVPVDAVNSEYDWNPTSSTADVRPLAVCDVDGDFQDDLVIGRPLYNRDTYAYQNVGAITVHFGPQASNGNFTQVNVVANPEPSPFVGEQFGFHMSCADLNGDGYDDVLVTSLLTAPNGYKTWIIYGSANRNNVTSTNSKKLSCILGSSTYYFRSSVAVGDVDGDGYGDFVSMHERYNHRIYYGPFHSGTSIDSSNTSPIFQLGGGGGGANENSGYVYPLGDINHDGHADFAIAKPFEDVAVSGSNLIDLGKVYVVFGSSSRPNPVTNSIAMIYPDGTALEQFLHFGWGGVAAGDFDGDGEGDIIVGTFEADYGSFTNSGAAALYMGPNYLASTPQLLIHKLPAVNRFCGWSVAAYDTNHDRRDDAVLTCGNINDGLDDLIVIRDNL